MTYRRAFIFVMILWSSCEYFHNTCNLNVWIVYFYVCINAPYKISTFEFWTASLLNRLFGAVYFLIPLKCPKTLCTNFYHWVLMFHGEINHQYETSRYIIWTSKKVVQTKILMRLHFDKITKDYKDYISSKEDEYSKRLRTPLLHNFHNFSTIFFSSWVKIVCEFFR